MPINHKECSFQTKIRKGQYVISFFVDEKTAWTVTSDVLPIFDFDSNDSIKIFQAEESGFIEVFCHEQNGEFYFNIQGAKVKKVYDPDYYESYDMA